MVAWGSRVKPVLPLGCLRYKRESELPHEKFFVSVIPDGRLLVNMTRIDGDGTSVEDLTRSELEGLSQALSVAYHLQTHGFEKFALASIAPQVGVRETRQILGEYVLTGKDLLERKKFRDVIAVGDYVIDIHEPREGVLTNAQCPTTIFPYRCLVPRKVDNLLIAGRCVSGTHEAMASFRIMPTCLVTGQAAGVAPPWR